MVSRAVVVWCSLAFSLLNASPVLAQRTHCSEPIQVCVGYINLSEDFFERIGIDLPHSPRIESELTVRCAVLTNIEMYFLFSAPKTQPKKIRRVPTIRLTPGQWTLYRTPNVQAFLKSQRKPEYESREIGIKVHRKEGSEKVVIETCEIENNQFVNSTGSFAVLDGDEVAMIPVRSQGFLNVQVQTESDN